jgi:chromatin segregation and condensation protein Rec8/ScpA/Scc1 (kleisin family)
MSPNERNVLTAAGDLTLRVGSFEGPFDLLLHLCRTNEIDLAALPVRAITDQYLAHLESMEFRPTRRRTKSSTRTA